MATISTAIVGNRHQSPFNSVTIPYVVDAVVDLAKVAAKKGSAVAVGDVIQALHLPAGTQVLFAGVQVDKAITGTSTDAAVNLGVSGTATKYVSGYEIAGAASGAYAPAAGTAVTPAQVFTSAGTIDLVISTQTGTVTGGKLRVFAVVVDLSNSNNKAAAGIVQVGS